LLAVAWPPLRAKCMGLAVEGALRVVRVGAAFTLLAGAVVASEAGRA